MVFDMGDIKMHACCNWCLKPVKVSKDYDRLQHRAYCNKDCLEKDWLFMRWQSDYLLNLVIEDRKNGQD